MVLWPVLHPKGNEKPPKSRSRSTVAFSEDHSGWSSKNGSEAARWQVRSPGKRQHLIARGGELEVWTAVVYTERKVNGHENGSGHGTDRSQ